MKFNNLSLVTALLISFFALTGCNDATQVGANTSAPQVEGLTNGTSIVAPTGVNVMSFTVNGSTCSSGSYNNKPCVSITICNPGGTTVCQTVNDILLDTGSYGLRVFKTAISTLTLTQVNSKQGGALTDCAGFGDGSSEWGPVMRANVTLGGEAAVTIPIQVIDPSFGVLPSACSSPDANVSVAGFNGILGVGLEPNDCGSSCLGNLTGNQVYYNCINGNTGNGSSGTTATCAGGTTTTTADQVQNPVSSLATDNNGVMIRLPAISSSGMASTTGYMIFGVGTRSNNTPPSSTIKFIADGYANMKTNFNGTDYDGFLDTGSNGLFFTGPSSLPSCSGWYCPSSVAAFSATNRGADNTSSTPRGIVNFQIASSTALFSSGFSAFNDLGANTASLFDFGLPFYYGRDVYLVIDGKTATTYGSGPYWVY